MDSSNILLLLPVLLFSVVAHEYAHGYAALKQGDPTAYQLGRLTFNPIKHIDPMMTVILPLVLYLAGAPVLAGAKPVPVNPRNYRNYKRGDIIVSMAGIVTNIGLALCATFLYGVVGLAGQSTAGEVRQVLEVLQHMLVLGIMLNLMLAVFNLLPIPPLDGSHVMKYLLPPAWSLQYQRLSGYGILILIALMYLGNGSFLNTWLMPAERATDALIHLVLPFTLYG